MILPIAWFLLQALQTPNTRQPQPAYQPPPKVKVKAKLVTSPHKATTQLRPDIKAQMAPQLALKAKAVCLLGFQGSINRQTNRETKGKKKVIGQVSIQGQQDFDIKIPGELEEWESPNGQIQYRFIPVPNGERAFGHFKSTERTVYQAKDFSFTLEGDYVAGMSTWYINSQGRGGELIPSATDVTMRGKVLASNNNKLKVGAEDVPVVISPIRYLPPQTGSPTHPPVLQFQGLALWALKNTKTRFTVIAEAVHEGRTAEEEVQGTTKITFDLTPLP